jgi:hypothetical protein
MTSNLARIGDAGGGRARARRVARAAVVALSAAAAAATTAFAVPQTIHLGDTCVGTLDQGQTSFPFFAVAGSDLTATLRTSGGLACGVTLYDPSGAPVPLTSRVNSMGDRVTLRGSLAATGVHTIVLDAKGTSGAYKMRAVGQVPTHLSFDGDADAGVQQWFTFDAMAGTQVSSITVRRVDATLSFAQPGALTGPSGAAVVLAKQKASAKQILATKATLADDGTYKFAFTPTGTGEWLADVKLVGPKVVGATLQAPAGTVRLSSVGSGVRVGVSTPPNGSNFVTGDKGWVAVMLNDDTGAPLSLSQLSTCNLYLYGPQDPTKTVTAVGMLNATTDRNAKPHHYVDLKTNPAVVSYANVVMYPLSAVSDEAPGTYTAACWAVLASDTKQQWFPVIDVQVGTATVETRVVEKDKCAACHLGPLSGKFYMHHVDPSGFAPNGNVAIDQWPTRTCKACHNNDGYAAYDNKAGGTDANVNRTNDPIVRRVHGVHMGEGQKTAYSDANGTVVIPRVGYPGLQNPFDVTRTVNPDGTTTITGDFKDYAETVFPADIRNCDKCHVDDRWKTTTPSQAICATCHDAVWFGSPTAVPPGLTAHTGGQKDDASCSTCHPESAPKSSSGIGVADAHGFRPSAPWIMNNVDIAMTAPVNGTYYTSADDNSGVTVTVTIHDDTGAAIDHTLVTDTNFSTASLFVYGPREGSVPVLTNAALNADTKKRASATCNNAATGSPAAWTFQATDTLKLAINGGAPFTLTVPGTSVTPAACVTWLNTYFTANSISAVAAVSGGTKVKIDSTIQNWQGVSEIDIYNCPVTTVMGWKQATPFVPYAGAVGSALLGTTMEPLVKAGAGSTYGNDLRFIKTPNPLDWYDPLPVRTTANVTYQLPGKFANLAPGTYMAYVYAVPNAGKVANFANVVAMNLITFQVGTATPEPKVATNCVDCHGVGVNNGTMHLYESHIHPAKFDPDYCKACHDYQHLAKGDGFIQQGGTSTSGWSGFGTTPIARRVHGVHNGAYLAHPEEIYPNSNNFGDVIFPQDVRNCTKCHAQSDTWKQKPSRLACMACHDTDAAKAHGAAMTYIANVMDPYGPSAQESCAVCHGDGAEFSVSKVHSISNPYVPPYPREESK